MKFFKSILPALFLSLALFSCNSKDDVAAVAEETSGPAFSGTNGIFRPASTCGASRYSTLVDGSGTVFGNVEIVNDGDMMYMLITMTPVNMLTELNVYYGSAAGIPVNSDGLLEDEAFSYRITGLSGFETYTFYFDASSLPKCNTFVVKATSMELDWSGSMTTPTTLWMDGASYYDGYSFNDCKGDCPVIPAAGFSGSSL